MLLGTNPATVRLLCVVHRLFRPSLVSEPRGLLRFVASEPREDRQAQAAIHDLVRRSEADGPRANAMIIDGWLEASTGSAKSRP